MTTNSVVRSIGIFIIGFGFGIWTGLENSIDAKNDKYVPAISTVGQCYALDYKHQLEIAHERITGRKGMKP